MMKPDFDAMTRKELKTYVSTHRDDDEALAVLIRKIEAIAPKRSIEETEQAFEETLNALKKKQDSDVA